ncbi:MYND-type domain-containing protein [Mycena indigotica]|uniref:MYND-type domain-containing protein n=1 Tax=Mycena indigotica TaxID=2126181 RepID=A0A8H6S4C5_9AGAR|nr:MYND-type domain-containing protein [Mycena indigotica]XP_037215353.1 MYND-type domain-containing protein [Mycena indigotica]KAF7292920.1 MYND-type domain-containing protein [Mycena indigotica]KAF7292925.1 MYND-type domain-containing protein [Mycena indigotica]
MSSTARHNHDQDCSCADPNSRLTNASLAKIAQRKDALDPQQLSPQDIDATVTFCLEYLQATDVPLREKGCCTHVMGQLHAKFALEMLAKISYILRPSVDSPFVARLVEAWPGIWKWLEYTFQDWIVHPMYKFEYGGTETGRYNAFVMVISSLRSFIKLPPICDLLLADQGGLPVYRLLGSCWFFEDGDEFKDASKNDRLLSAAEPLLDITTYVPGRPSDLFFGCLMFDNSQDSRESARVALNHLSVYLDQPAPWSPPLLFLLDYHLRMLSNMVIYPQYRTSLVAAFGVRTVVRILVALTSTTYDDGIATGIAQAIVSALTFLHGTLPSISGYAWTIHSIQVGLLPALLRAQEWMDDLPEDRDAKPSVEGLLKFLSLYTIYPSVLRPLLASLRRIEELNLEEKLKDSKTFHELYQQLKGFIKERSTISPDMDVNMRCSTCRNIDTNNNFSSCSGCFTVSYCSQDCQKAHWKSAHRAECKTLKELRAEGRAPALQPGSEDYEFATRKVVMNEIGRRKAEIVPVWRADPPERTPCLSFTLTQVDNPRGVIVVGAPEKQPGYHEHQEFRVRWDGVVNNGLHNEHIIIGISLPWGCYAVMHFLWLGAGDDVAPGANIVERLFQTVELM